MIVTNYSVLMSVYDKEDPYYLEQSIESMINQSYPPDEIVIVKDGQLTNELDEVINSFIFKSPDLFKIVSLDENVGLGKALNEGLKECKNELVARMDSDDLSIKKRCELQIKEFLMNSSLSIVGSNIDEFFDHPKNIKSSRIVPSEHEAILKFSRRRNPFNHPTIMYKKSAVLQEGGYGNYRRNQDFDLFVHMLNKGYIAKNLNKSLVLFRADEGNSTRRKSWTKCKIDIGLMYKFWKKGFSSFSDFCLVTIINLAVFISPVWLFKRVSKAFLRDSYDK